MPQKSKVFLLFIIILLLCRCNTGTVKSGVNKVSPKAIPQKLHNMTYSEKLQNCKTDYPFARWREAFDHGLEQYTEENCNKFELIFDDLIGDLTKLGEHSESTQKEEAFKKAVLALNDLGEADESLIETGEREDLCALIDQITIASGLNPKDYGEGEGLASEWREW